ncbi:MAG TPA: metal ABC transporter substrate-binding protein [Nitrospiria bacterium]|nr:metal ABC transporter substrate-binding protein [Nitrospiria bacterium]
MKGFGYSFAAALVLFSLCGSVRAEKPIRIVASTGHYAAIAKIVGGDRVEVRSLLKDGQGPRGVEPKPSLLVPLNQTDLLVESGRDLELGWLTDLLTRSTNRAILPEAVGHVDASEGVDLIFYKGNQVDLPLLASFFGPRGEELTSIANPYYHLDPASGEAIARNIYQKLIAIDPDHAADYRARLGSFRNRLSEKMKEWDARMAPYRGRSVAADRHSWDYLARRHGFSIVGYIEPRVATVSTSVVRPPDSSQAAALAGEMKALGIGLLLQEENDTDRVVGETATRAGARRIVLPAMIEKENPSPDDYFAFYNRLYGKLASALQEKGN